VDSGLMIAQYTQAAMVAENKRLAAPASVDSIPSSAMQEDHVSMGWGAARKLRSALANLRRILAIELVAAARGIDLRAPLQPAPATAAAVAELRTIVPGPGPDRFLAPELAAAEDLLRAGRLAAAVSAVTGDLRLRPPPACPPCPARSRTGRWPRARRPAPPCTPRRRRCSRRRSGTPGHARGTARAPWR
jgi:histidine ammonia-lyase